MLLQCGLSVLVLTLWIALLVVLITIVNFRNQL
ncbi:unnamed protein product [Ectocarpus sp. 12 AP-2014]